MTVDRALQLNTTALAVTGAVFLGLGHESIVMPLLLAAGAIAAFTLTDVLKWIRLNRLAANLVALVAVAWSLKDFFDTGRGSEQQLLAIANMLVYLQVVLLFQDKTPRLYWQLLVLSLLQAVVAAALGLGPLFGLLLAPYVLLALAHLLLLCLHHELAAPKTLARPGAAAEPWRALLAPPVVSAGGNPAEELESAFGGRRIARQVVALGAATLLFTAVFFYATPRLSDAAWQSGRGRGAVSGLANEVRLKESGSIQLSDQVVLRALLTRLNDRQPVVVVGEPYFTGSTLTEYRVEDGVSRWVMGPRPSRAPMATSNAARRPLTNVPGPGEFPRPTLLARQDIVLEVGSTPTYPAIVPAQRLNDTPQHLTYRRMLNRVERIAPEGETQGREYRYSLATPAIRGGRQLYAMPHPNPAATPTDPELSTLAQFEAGRFPQLAATAARILSEQNPPAESSLQRALALQQHFHTPGLYRYSLELAERKRDLDPIEDFVANHRTGYCEYFASALVLMLRSQGIPARMIIGYKGGELNSLGHYYVVKQRHAHAWVEAWLPAGDVPEWEIAGPVAGGVWYRLDPTPGADEAAAVVTEESLARRVMHGFDYVDLLWREYVLSLNKTQQERSVYEPLTARATALPAWLEARYVHRLLRQWSVTLGIPVPPPTARGPRPFEGSLALLIAGGLLLAFVLYQAAVFARWLFVRWWKALVAGRKARGHAPGFYLRLERLLARLPLRRRAGQTARELAAEAERRLQGAVSEEPSVAGLPEEIVAVYYRVRFGAARLDKTQAAAIEQALDRLAPAVRQARPR